MHYGRTAFSSNGQNTIEPTAPYASHLNTIGQRSYLSDLDKAGMAARYGAPPSSDDNYEPNNTYSAAWGLFDEQVWLDTVDGLGIQKDDDWYRISVSAGYNRVTVEADFVNADGDIDISLHDSSGGFLASSTSVSDDEMIDFSVDPAGGTYYIRVYYGDAGNTYNLWWNGTRPVDLNDAGSAYHSLSSTTVEQGQNITVGHRLRNSGVDASGTFQVSYYLSSNSTISTADYLLGTTSEASLSENSTRLESNAFPVTSNIPAGSYYLGWIIDSGSAVSESDEGNNTAYVDQIVTVTEPPRLDLSSSSQSIPYSGGNRTITVSSNTPWSWSKPTSPWVSTSEATNQTGNQSFTYSVAANPDPAPRSVSFTFTNGFQTRSHSVSQEAAPATIDLLESAGGPRGISSSLITQGENVTISHVLENTGNSPSGAFVVRYYLSTNNIISAGDVLIGQANEGSMVRESTRNNNALVNVSVSVPTGVYYLGWIVDPTNVVSETSESNNTAVLGQQVTIRTNSPPPSVTGLTVEDTSWPVRISWDSMSITESYEIWRGTSDSLGSMTKLGETSDTAYLDAGVTSGDRYHYRVVGKNWNGNGGHGQSRYIALFETVDMLVKRPRQRTHIGDDIYDTYTGQTVGYRTTRKSGVYSILLQNENEVGTEALRGGGSKRNRTLSLAYFSSAGNVTGDMLREDMEAPVDGQSFEEMKVKIRATSAARKRRRSKLVVSTSIRFADAASIQDVGRMIHTFKNKKRR